MQKIILVTFLTVLNVFAAFVPLDNPRRSNLYIFSAKWCGPCHTMEKNVWSSKTFQKELSGQDVVTFKLDFDDPKNAKYVKYYEITTLPTIVLTDRHGFQKGRYVGYTDITGVRNFLAEKNIGQD